MSDKDVADKVVDKTEDFEKRYNDSQTHIATIERENKEMRDSSLKDKELLDAVTPFVDWDAVKGTKEEPANGGETLVDQKTLQSTVKELRDQIATSNNRNAFMIKYPEMVEHQILVEAYYGKTDPRRPFEERIEKAVESTKKLLESERAKGRESDDKEKREKAAKEAGASGLTAAKGQKGTEEEPDGESFDDYVKDRQARQNNNMGA